MVSHCTYIGIGKILQIKSLSGKGITKNYCAGGRRRKGTPRCIWQNASFTIEAAFLFPMVLCFLVSILFFFRVMQVELQVEKALAVTGETFAASAPDSSKISETAMNAVMLKLMLQKELSGNKSVSRYVKGGADGISILGSKLNGDFIDIHSTFTLPLPIQLPGIPDIKIERRLCARKWTGFHRQNADSEAEKWVYITETGKVYHQTKECSHLKLTVSKVRTSAVSEKRNQNGGKYYKCEKCAKEEKKPDIVYITAQGERYHYDIGCSGLKRTIFMIRLSETGDRTACRDCSSGDE